MLVDNMFSYEVSSLELLLTNTTLEDIILNHIRFVVAEVFFTSLKPSVEIILHFERAFFQ
jgi:hypothetical protein